MGSMASEIGIPEPPAKLDYADYLIGTVTGLSFAISAVFLGVLPWSGKIASGRDFVSYWATGQQLVHHCNPYDGSAIMRIEQSAGTATSYGVLYMRNPPWALPLALPLGYINISVAAFLWSALLVGCLFFSIHLLRQMFDSPANYLHWIAASFAPALICILMGQTSLFALLGYVLFLKLNGSRPFLAGASLWLCTLKPHLFLVFGAVLLVWIVLTKSYRILAGLATAMAASCAIVQVIDRTAWTDYMHMMRTTGIEAERIPCPSVALRILVSPHLFILTWVPVTLATIWALVYFWHRRSSWDWMSNGSLLMLVSLVVAPYCWVYDGGLAIPALLRAAYRTSSRILITILALASLAIDIEIGSGINVPSFFYIWTMPVWLAWYLCATGIKTKTMIEDHADVIVGDAAIGA
jgi:hypothetical protein